MVSHLSDEEFERLQKQLIELRTSNYSLEEQCKKLKNDNQRLGEKLSLLEKEYQKLQKTINRSRKAKDIDLLLSENENLQVKLEAQEDEFRLQSQTLMQELSSLVAANEKLEKELNTLKKQDDTSFSSTSHDIQGQFEKAALSRVIAEEQAKAEIELGELRDAIQFFRAGEADIDQEDSIPSSDGDFVQVGETDVTYQKRSRSWSDVLKQAEQKLQHLEAHQKNVIDTLARLQQEEHEKQKLESELKQAQEKLRRKQDSLIQLQEEKERFYTESRKAYEELQAGKDEEILALKEQSQRLQVQLNNSQSTLQDYKEKACQKIEQLESQLLLLKKKTESNCEERLLELQAKVIELECVLGETREELQAIQQHKAQLETQLVDVQGKLMEQETLTSEWEEQQTRLTAALEEVHMLAQKRKNLVDEMSIRMQQKSDDYKHQLSNLTNEFSNKEDKLRKQIQVLQTEVERLTPLQSQLQDTLVQVNSLEAMRGWLERRQKEAEDNVESTRTYYEGMLENLRAEHCQELSQLKQSCDSHEKALEEDLETLKNEYERKNETLRTLEQQLHDAGEEKHLAEKKGAAVMKDLRRQLASERKRVEKLQERLRDLLNEGATSKTDLNKTHDPETSSISSWSLMSGNCEPRESSTRENSIVASNFNGNVSPSPEDQDLEQENYRLLSRITALQQEKWVLEEKLNHLEEGSSGMAEDLMKKTALIQYYCMEGRSDPVASTSSPSSERSSVKKFVEMLKKGDEHVHESNRKMLRMLEETLTKNMHLGNDLERLSLEVCRLREEKDSETSM